MNSSIVTKDLKFLNDLGDGTVALHIIILRVIYEGSSLNKYKPFSSFFSIIVASLQPCC